VDGLGLAETTPGPLIMVLQFAGFLAAYRSPGSVDPMLAGFLGGALTTWVTFAPCFLWIFLGAPYVERRLSCGAHHRFIRLGLWTRPARACLHRLDCGFAFGSGSDRDVPIQDWNATHVGPLRVRGRCTSLRLNTGVCSIGTAARTINLTPRVDTTDFEVQTRPPGPARRSADTFTAH
jgi:hypothetical protein